MGRRGVRVVHRDRDVFQSHQQYQLDHHAERTTPGRRPTICSTTRGGRRRRGSSRAGAGTTLPNCPTRTANSGTNITLYRLQSPGLGRWLSPDPLGGDITNPQSLNRYPYVLNNPTTFIDPLGLFMRVGDCSWYGTCMAGRGGGALATHCIRTRQRPRHNTWSRTICARAAVGV